MKYLTLFAVIFCVPWNPCYAQEAFRWGRWEAVTPWVPEQAAAMGRFVQPQRVAAPVRGSVLSPEMTKPLAFQCKGCPFIKLPPAPK